MQAVTVVDLKYKKVYAFESEGSLKYFIDEKNGIEGHKDENGKLHGLIVYYEDGSRAKPYKTAEYHHGELHGEVKHFTITEKRVSAAVPDQKSDILKSEEKPGLEYAKFNVILESALEYHNGILMNSRFFLDGKLSEIYHVNGEDKGLFIRYDINEPGRICETGLIYSNGKRAGEWKTFLPDGDTVIVTNYHRDLKHGTETHLYKGETQIRSTYQEGLKHGKEWAYVSDSLFPTELNLSENYPTKMVAERTYANGILNGPYIEKIEGSIVVKGMLLDGLRHGRWEYFDRARKLVRSENYRDGELSGLTTTIKDGVIVEGTMANGKREGLFHHLQADRSKILTVVYSSGVERFRIFYDGKGAETEIASTRDGVKEGYAYQINGEFHPRLTYYRDGTEAPLPLSKTRTDEQSLDKLDKLEIRIKLAPKL